MQRWCQDYFVLIYIYKTHFKRVWTFFNLENLMYALQSQDSRNEKYKTSNGFNCVVHPPPHSYLDLMMPRPLRPHRFFFHFFFNTFNQVPSHLFKKISAFIVKDKRYLNHEPRDFYSYCKMHWKIYHIQTCLKLPRHASKFSKVLQSAM